MPPVAKYRETLADERGGLGHQGDPDAHDLARLDLRIGSHGPDGHHPVPAIDTPEPVHPAQIDQMPEAGEPKSQQRYEALAASQHLGIVKGGQQLGGLVDGLGRVVVEWCRFHELFARLGAG